MQDMDIRSCIGTKDFYKETARIAIPLALQNLLLSCQSMIDTLMVSWIGKVSAVGTAALIDTLAMMIAYGCLGGISIFASQFYGAGDDRNLKRCTGLGFCLVMANALFWFLMAAFFGQFILSFYIKDAGVVADGMLYLRISKYSLLATSFSLLISNMFRSLGETRIILAGSILTSVTNVVLNYLLIFGVGPFPEMGIEGAALATLLAIVLTGTALTVYAFATKQKFVGRLPEMFDLDMNFAGPILEKATPLILNEAAFGFGQTMFIKAFGYLGKEQMDAYYVGNQIYNLLTFIIYGYGSAVQVLLGQKLGRGEVEQAKIECHWHMSLAFVIACILVFVLVVFAEPMVSLFALEDPVSEALAISIVHVLAVKVSMRLYNFMIFCILRSGGDSRVIQFLDSGIEWLVGVTSAYFCVLVLKMDNIALVLLVTQLEQLVRLILGMKRVRSYRWANDLTKLVPQE